MKSSTADWYQLNYPGQIDSPALLVFPERVTRNIQTAISMVGDPGRLRPHIKTCKSPDAVRLMLEAGITKFKCATISEAELLGMVEAPDVLLAYQPMGPKLHRFIELIKKFPKTIFSCLTDNPSIANEQAKAFEREGLSVGVYIDINTGMNRTGISPEGVIALMNFIATQKAIKCIGWHAYDGHLHDPDFSKREKQANKCYQPIELLLNETEKRGLQSPRIIAGGSPTFPIHANRKDVECSPGTFVYWDKTYLDICGEQDFLPALVILTRVVSLPGPGLITIDLGHKSVAAENSIGRRVYILDGEDLEPVSQSEEHLVLQNSGTKKYSVGDILYGLPYHVCPTVALYERLVTIQNGVPTGEWLNISRNRKIGI